MSSTSSQKAFRTLLLMLGKHKLDLFVGLVLSILGSIVQLTQPLVVNKMLQQIGSTSITPKVALLVVLLFIGAIAGGLKTYVLTRTAERSVYVTRQQLIARLLRLPISSFNTLRTGDLVSRLGSDTTLIRAAFTGGLVDSMASIFAVVGAVVFMAVLDPILLLVVIVVLSVTVGIVIVASARIQLFTKRLQTAVGDLGADMERSLVAVRTLRALNAENEVERELVGQADRAWRQGNKVARFEGMLDPLVFVALQLCFLFVLGVGGVRVAAGNMQLGELLAFIMYLFTLAMPIGLLFGAITTIRSAMGAVERVNEVLALDVEVNSGPDISPASELEFRNVCFAYDQEEPTPTVKSLTFTIQPGSKVAIVGPSGSGKSTTLALIQRFYDPNDGQILLGGQNISEYSRTSLRRIVGFLEQEASILAGTVRENLKLGAREATDVQCWEVLRKVGLEEKFQHIKGLDTKLGERGISLSGGQRQRLALARTLLLDTPILLMDEPTSAVDSYNEKLILSTISEQCHGRTIVMVAHRLSTVIDADQILVMNQGSIVSSGTHSELMDNCPLYRDLAKRQSLA
ncbi:ABC transporter ATP-binding protein [Corynebacterium resistens]|nr:ABC transporter ATP-binding protein [Corynebacterium resistens]